MSVVRCDGHPTEAERWIRTQLSYEFESVVTRRKRAATRPGRIGPGPTFIHVVLAPGNAPVGNIPFAPAEIRERFMRAIRG